MMRERERVNSRRAETGESKWADGSYSMYGDRCAQPVAVVLGVGECALNYTAQGTHAAGAGHRA